MTKNVFPAEFRNLDFENVLQSVALVWSFTLLLPFFLFLLSVEAQGDEFKIIPSLQVRGESNDNILFTQDHRMGDLITTLSPAVEVIKRTERLDASLLGRFNWLKYAENDDLSGAEHDYRGKLRFSAHPRLSVSAEAGYKSHINPTGDVDVTGLVLSPVRRHLQDYIGRAEYVFSETTRSSLSYSYQRSDYKDPRYIDVQAHDVALGLLHDLSLYFPATMARVNTGYSRYQSQKTTTDYYYGTIGSSRALSEKWDFLIDAGGSYTLSTFEVERFVFVPPFFSTLVREKKKAKEWGWVGQATLSYKGEKTSGDLVFNHRRSLASGSAGVVERTSLTLGMSHRFTYELSGRLSAGYYINQEEKGTFSRGGMDEVTFRIHPVLRYEFTKDIALEGSYSYTYTKDKLRDTEHRRNLVVIHFIIQYPLFE